MNLLHDFAVPFLFCALVCKMDLGTHTLPQHRGLAVSGVPALTLCRPRSHPQPSLGRSCPIFTSGAMPMLLSPRADARAKCKGHGQCRPLGLEFVSSARSKLSLGALIPDYPRMG